MAIKNSFLEIAQRDSVSGVKGKTKGKWVAADMLLRPELAPSRVLVSVMHFLGCVVLEILIF